MHVNFLQESVQSGRYWTNWCLTQMDLVKLVWFYCHLMIWFRTLWFGCCQFHYLLISFHYNSFIPDGAENNCLYLSNWNSTIGQYGGDKYELYSTPCIQYRRRFLCQNVEGICSYCYSMDNWLKGCMCSNRAKRAFYVFINQFLLSAFLVRYPGYKLDDGVLQKDIADEFACKMACIKYCQAAEYNTKTKECLHHYQQTACRPGKATSMFKSWIHYRKHHCGISFF